MWHINLITMAQCAMCNVHFTFCWLLFSYFQCINNPTETVPTKPPKPSNIHWTYSFKVAWFRLNSECHRRDMGNIRNIFSWYIFGRHFIIKLHKRPESFRHPICTMHKWLWAHVWETAFNGGRIYHTHIHSFTQTHFTVSIFHGGWNSKTTNEKQQ